MFFKSAIYFQESATCKFTWSELNIEDGTSVTTSLAQITTVQHSGPTVSEKAAVESTVGIVTETTVAEATVDATTNVGETIKSTVSCDNWNPPSGWTSSCPVLYRSFDNADGLVLMEGTTSVNSASIVIGQV